jgi:hypothetical protein
MTRLLSVAGFVLCIAIASQAQIESPATIGGRCAGQIYHAANVTRPARLNNFGELMIPKEAQERNVRGTIVINVVLCRNGRVSNINVVTGLPFGLTLSAVNKLLNAQFRPAELNFHSVSQALQFQFSLNESGVSTVVKTEFSDAVARLVEEIAIIGNRRTDPHQILSQLKTHAGDPFNPDEINQDLQTLLRNGNFDKIGTRVTVDDAPRGGVRVVFEVVELPLIREFRFDRLSLADQASVVEALSKWADLRPGVVFDPPRLFAASRIIEGFLRSRGSRDVKVETVIERPSATDAIVIFKISAAKP